VEGCPLNLNETVDKILSVWNKKLGLVAFLSFIIWFAGWSLVGLVFGYGQPGPLGSFFTVVGMLAFCLGGITFVWTLVLLWRRIK